jgi:hypothetical protein
MGTGYFPRLKRPGSGVGHSTPSIAEVKERIELYLYSLSRPSCPVLGGNYGELATTFPYTTEEENFLV